MYILIYTYTYAQVQGDGKTKLHEKRETRKVTQKHTTPLLLLCAGAFSSAWRSVVSSSSKSPRLWSAWDPGAWRAIQAANCLVIYTPRRCRGPVSGGPIGVSSGW